LLLAQLKDVRQDAPFVVPDRRGGRDDRRDGRGTQTRDRLSGNGVLATRNRSRKSSQEMIGEDGNAVHVS
jgi:hypothetical protein